MLHFIFALALNSNAFAQALITLNPPMTRDQIAEAIRAGVPMAQRFWVESDDVVRLTGEIELRVAEASGPVADLAFAGELEAVLRGEGGVTPRLDLRRATVRVRSGDGREKWPRATRPSAVLDYSGAYDEFFMNTPECLDRLERFLAQLPEKYDLNPRLKFDVWSASDYEKTDPPEPGRVPHPECDHLLNSSADLTDSVQTTK